MEPEEYETFLSSLKKEKQLRERIRLLKRYRKNGVTKTEGVCVCVCARMHVRFYIVGCAKCCVCVFVLQVCDV